MSESVLCSCFKNVIKRSDFENYCEFFEIEDKEKTFNSLRDRGYVLNFVLPKPEEEEFEF